MLFHVADLMANHKFIILKADCFLAKGNWYLFVRRLLLLE